MRTDSVTWDRLFTAAQKLVNRLAILDVAVYLTPYDSWYAPLEEYATAIQKKVVDDELTRERGQNPSIVTTKGIEELNDTSNPTHILLALESSIRMAHFELKKKWDHIIKSK